MCALYVCLICVPYMYALYVCRIGYVSLICVPYMYALYVCLICMSSVEANSSLASGVQHAERAYLKDLVCNLMHRESVTQASSHSRALSSLSVSLSLRLSVSVSLSLHLVHLTSSFFQTPVMNELSLSLAGRR